MPLSLFKVDRMRCFPLVVLIGFALAVSTPIADAASSAVSADTRPFAVAPAAAAAAKALIGTSCAAAFHSDGPSVRGFAKPAGFIPIGVRDGYIVGGQRAGARFAFLLSVPNGDIARCRIADVVALPTRAQADAFFSCHSDDGSTTGVGMRRVHPSDLVAYWSVERSRFVRQPVHVIGVDSFTCHQPESGE